jgi:8-oxo-dGTP diphosphatase
MIERDEEHFFGKVAQKAIIVKGTAVLLSRDVDDATTWELPGGRLNVDEDPKKGLARELFEELGVVCEIGDVVYSEQFFHTRAQQHSLLLAYVASLEDLNAQFILADDEVAEVRWVDFAAVKEYEIYDNCRHALEHYLSTHA